MNGQSLRSGGGQKLPTDPNPMSYKTRQKKR
jgi:hypothetical protein